MIQLMRRLDSGDQKARAEISEIVRQTGQPRLNLGRAKLVDTKSNLRSQVLKEILQSLGVSNESFETKQRLIDVVLCDRRNEIAHGRANFPPPVEVLELVSQVLGMMEEIRDLAISQVTTKSYLAS